jgi:hypothetical protein
VPAEFLTPHEAARVALDLLSRSLGEMAIVDNPDGATDGRRLFRSQLGVIEDWVTMHALSALGGHS